jgi:hypothetical protein
MLVVCLTVFCVYAFGLYTAETHCLEVVVQCFFDHNSTCSYVKPHVGLLLFHLILQSSISVEDPINAWTVNVACNSGYPDWAESLKHRDCSLAGSVIALPSRQRIFGTLCGVADVSDVRAAFKVWHDYLTLNGGSRFFRKVGRPVICSVL